MSIKDQSGQSNDKEKEIYFIILRPNEKVDLDLDFSSSEFTPSRIYKKENRKRFISWRNVLK